MTNLSSGRRPTTVANIKECPSGWETNPAYEYIGRGWRQHPRASKWGNPFRERDFGRDECIRRHREEVERKLSDPTQKQFWQDLKALQGKILVCYCFPKPCHGTILCWYADLLGGYDQSNQGQIYFIDPQWVEDAQRDYDLYHEFNLLERELKEELRQENESLQFQFDVMSEKIVDLHSLKEVLKQTVKKPYDRQEVWLEFRRRRNETR